MILSNGWDRTARDKAASKFNLSRDELEQRHEPVFMPLEAGRITLAEYLDKAIFHCARPFGKEEFTTFMFAQSRERAKAREILDNVSSSYLVAAINNEPRELNNYRIKRFDLRRNFVAFFSSCYTGMRKPDKRIYQLALDVTQRLPEECLFIDDRPANVEGARQVGIRGIHFRSPAQLRREFAANGIKLGTR